MMGERGFSDETKESISRVGTGVGYWPLSSDVWGEVKNLSTKSIVISHISKGPSCKRNVMVWKAIWSQVQSRSQPAIRLEIAGVVDRECHCWGSLVKTKRLKQLPREITVGDVLEYITSICLSNAALQILALINNKLIFNMLIIKRCLPKKDSGTLRASPPLPSPKKGFPKKSFEICNRSWHCCQYHMMSRIGKHPIKGNIVQ